MTFEEHRAHLTSVAYRMLGTMSDAEDAVQETYLRWHDADHESIKSPRAWLTTVITRICIDTKRSASARREEYVGPWLPEPLPELADAASDDSPAEHTALAETLSICLLAMLERLSPSERATFVLRDGKIVEHEDVFSFWRWSRQALGVPGVLMGWTPMLKNKVRGAAGKQLERYLEKNKS